MTKKSALVTTIETQRNIIEGLRAENERLRDILKRNGIDVDTKLPDWMSQKQDDGWSSGKVDVIAIWGNGGRQHERN
jgi:hypothetical protein